SDPRRSGAETNEWISSLLRAMQLNAALDNTLIGVRSPCFQGSGRERPSRPSARPAPRPVGAAAGGAREWARTRSPAQRSGGAGCPSPGSRIACESGNLRQIFLDSTEAFRSTPRVSVQTYRDTDANGRLSIRWSERFIDRVGKRLSCSARPI